MLGTYCARFGRGFAVANDRSVRFLSALGGASTSRVLNLFRIAADNADNPEHAGKAAVRLAPHQQAPSCSSTAPAPTRPICSPARARWRPRSSFPSTPTDLRAGGRSLFVDQRGYAETLREAGNYTSDALERDLSVLRLLNAVPSLDPFLLREHLRNNKIEVAPCYFAISEGDQERMHALRQPGNVQADRCWRAATATPAAAWSSAMLSNQIDEKLEPLRLTLGLTGNDFREGVFSWRGFLYYKWSMGKFWPDVMGVLREINTIQPMAARRRNRRSILTAARRNIIEMVRDNGNHVNKALAVYDASFDDLVEHQTPKTFRDFLLSAPYMFLELGEKLGAISHIVSFWRYRFPPGGPSISTPKSWPPSSRTSPAALAKSSRAKARSSRSRW